MRLATALLVYLVFGASSGLAATLPSLPGPVIPTPTPSSAFTLRHILDNPLAFQGNGFGAVAATDGTLALIGSPRGLDLDDPGNPDTGQQGGAALFDVKTGALLQSFANPLAPASGSRFGSATAVGDGRLVIGAEASSQAFVFDAQTFQLDQTLQPPSSESFQRFGAGVAVGDGEIFVGAPERDVASATDNAGQAFRFIPPIPNPVRILDNPTPRPNGGLGADLAYDDGLLLASEAGTGSTAFVQNEAFLFDVSTGGVAQTLVDPNPGSQILDNRNLFGDSVALAGNFAVVGDPGDDLNGLSSGAVVVFNKSTGAVVRTLQSPDLQVGDQFGEAVATDGIVLAVGEPGHGTVRDASGLPIAGPFGQVHVFDILSGNLIQTIANPDPGMVRNGSFGAALAFAGDTLVIGSSGFKVGIPFQNSAFFIPRNGGRAFVYSRAAIPPDDIPPDDIPPVPLPAPLALLGAALLGLIGAARRRR